MYHKVKDGRGQHMKAIRAENLKKIIAWISRNPDANAMECSIGTGLCYSTTRSLIKELKAGGIKGEKELYPLP